MVIQETYNADSIGGIVGMVRRILIGTFTVEGVGALFYAVQFVPEYGLLRGIGYSIFHSVSAFCNAGIDILGSDSLAKYICNPLINITTMLLIILSGIGFGVWYDVLGNIKKSPKERNSWKMVVYKTPAAFKACNRDNLDIAGSGNIIDIFTGIS